MNKNYTENIVTIFYFEFNGRALISKAILHYLKIPFKSVKFTQDQWQNEMLSGKYEFNQLPALEMNNKIYVQSIAIEVLLAKKYNLMGDNFEDEWSISSILCSKNDLITHLRPFVRPDMTITDFEKEKFLNYILPLYISAYEKRLNCSRGKYFICDKVTLADIALSVLIYYIFFLNMERLYLRKILKKNTPKLYDFVLNFIQNELKNFFQDHYDFLL